MYVKATVNEGAALPRKSRGGDGFIASPRVPAAVTTDANTTIGVDSINSGIYLRSGMTAGRTDTTPTGVALDASNEGMDVGDTFLLAVSVTVAFALTLAGGVGVTMQGKTVVPASGMGWFVVTKTGVGTFTFFGL